MIELSNLIEKFAHEKKWDDIYVCSKINNVKHLIFKGISNESVRIKRFEKGILYLETESAAWRTELFLRKEQIINKINNLINIDVVKDMIIK